MEGKECEEDVEVYNTLTAFGTVTIYIAVALQLYSNSFTLGFCSQVIV